MNYCFRLFLFLLVVQSHAQDFHFVDFISDDIRITREDKITTIALPFEILEGYHIQLEEVEDDNLIPTKMNYEVPAQFEIISSEFDCVHYEIVNLDKQELKVMSHNFEVIVRLRIKDASKPLKLIGSLYYQTCDDFKCYFPRNLDFEIPFN